MQQRCRNDGYANHDMTQATQVARAKSEIDAGVVKLEKALEDLRENLVLESVLEFVLGFSVRPLPGSGWLVLDGVVTLLLASMIASGFPASSAWAIGTLVAISMFFSGLTRVMVSVAMRTVVA